MKKLLALIMALAMLLSLAACASSSGSSSDDTSETTETTAEETAKEEASEEEATSAYESNPIHLILATYSGEDSIVGMTLNYFGAYLEEQSGGDITYDIYYNNTYCSMIEVLDNLSNGTIDVADVLCGMYGSQLPYFDVTVSDDSAASAVALAQTLYFENEETASAAEAQFADANIKLLSFDCAGAIGYVSTKEVSSYNDLKSLVFGTARNYDYFVACGLNVVSIDGGEFYESLRLGICDATSCSLGGIISDMFYEVAPYTLFVKEYSIVCGTSINLDTYNSMNASQQALVAEAAAASSAYNIQLCEDYEQEYLDTIVAETGNELAYITDDELAFIYRTELEATYAASLSYAENLGCADEYKAIVEAQWAFSNLSDGSELNLD